MNRPNHYCDNVLEPITFNCVNDVPFMEGNVIKYVMRWRKKRGVEDLKKARRYLDLLIEYHESGIDAFNFVLSQSHCPEKLIREGKNESNCAQPTNLK